MSAASEPRGTELPLQLHGFVLFDLAVLFRKKLHLVLLLPACLPLEPREHRAFSGRSAAPHASALPWETSLAAR